MKKKVLALVVLAAMLISILPMAAFAAADSYYSAIKVKEDSAAADGLPATPTEEDLDDNEYLEYEITLRGSDYQGTTGTLYVATSRPSVDKIYVMEGATKGEVVQSSTTTDPINVTNSNGVVKIRIYSGVPGTTKIGFGVEDGSNNVAAELVNYVQGRDNSSATDARAIDQKLYTATFTSAAVGDDGLDDSYYTNSYAPDFPLANGSQKYTITAVLKAANGAPVSGKEVTFSVNKTGARLSETKVTTDSNGEAEVKLYADKADTYKVTIKADDADDKEITGLQFVASGIDTVKMESSNNQKIALKEEATFKFSFYDANGNQFPVNLPVFDDGVVKSGTTLEDAEITLTTAPSGAKLDLENENHFSVELDDVDANGNYGDILKIKINKNYLDKEGDYAIRFTLPNGKNVTYNFNVKEQGDITNMIFTYKSESMPAIEGALNKIDDLKLADAEGYSKNAELSDVTFSINNTKLAKVYAEDTVVGGDTIKKGTLELIDDSTGTITVTAVHDDKNIVASATVEIVNAPSTVKTTSDKVVAVGTEGEVKLQLVDVDGKAVAAAFPGDESASKVVITSKPAGAIVDTNLDSDFETDIEEKGSSSFTIISNTEGTVKYQVVVAVKGIQGTGTTTYYTGTGEVVFGKASAVTGNDIIFIIGASSYVVDGKPVAATSVPFIENGRTFLGIRDMGLAMGIIGDENIVWDKATQTAKLVKDGITVEVTVGATAIKVTKNSVTTEVAIDAPAQNKDGRVFLPFRAVFEAFGYSVEYANGTITVAK